MAAPTIRGSTAPVAGLSTTSHANTAVGDLVICITGEKAGAGIPTHTLQSGFTEIFSQPHNDGSTDGRLSVAYKVATSAGATAYAAYTTDGTLTVYTGSIVITAGTYYAGGSPGEPIASAGVTGTTNAAPDPPQITGLDGDMLILIASFWHLGSAGTNTVAPGANYVEEWEVAGSADLELALATRAMTGLSASTENPPAWTDNVTPAGTSSVTIGIPAGPLARNVTASISAVVQQTGITATTSISAVVQQAGRTATTTADAVVRATPTITTSISAVVQGTVTASASADATVQSTRTVTASLDARVEAAGFVGDETTSLDAVIQQAGRTATTSADAVIQQPARTATTAISAAVQSAASATTSADAVVQSSAIATAAISAVVQGLASVTASADAVIQQPARTATAAISAVVQGSATAITAISAVVQGSASVTMNADAVVQGSAMASTGFDARVDIGPPSITTAIDAVIQSSPTISASVSAVVQGTLAATASLNAYVIVPVIEPPIRYTDIQGAIGSPDGEDDIVGALPEEVIAIGAALVLTKDLF